MEGTKYIVPREGLIIRFPHNNTILPKKGAIVPWTGRDGSYWRRRVNCGDVIISEPPVKEKAFKEDYKNKSFNPKKEVK